jgi:hypothetical protein
VNAPITSASIDGADKVLMDRMIISLIFMVVGD